MATVVCLDPLNEAEKAGRDALYRECAAELGAAVERLARGYEADEARRKDLLHRKLDRDLASLEEPSGRTVRPNDRLRGEARRRSSGTGDVGALSYDAEMSSARREEEGSEEAALRARYVETRARADRDRLEARDHADAALAFGRWLLGEKRFDDALKPLKRARDMGDREITFQPYFVEALLLVAETEMGRGQQARAKKTLEQIDLPLREMKATDEERSAMTTKLAALREALGKQEQATKAEAPAERWRHAKLGTGVLVSRHDGKVRLLFDDGVERVFPADRVERVE